MRLDPARFEHSLQRSAFFWMFTVSLATFGIARNSRSSRIIRSSFSCRHWRTAFTAASGAVVFCGQRRKREKCNQQSDRRISQDSFSRMRIGPCNLIETLLVQSLFRARQPGSIGEIAVLRETHFPRLSGSTGLLCGIR